jgi:ribosomal protein L36
VVCGCNPQRKAGHEPKCLVAQAMKFRCPDCKSRRRIGVGYVIRHTNLCPLREFQP